MLCFRIGSDEDCSDGDEDSSDFSTDDGDDTAISRQTAQDQVTNHSSGDSSFGSNSCIGGTA